jgi:hypothetical protein
MSNKDVYCCSGRHYMYYSILYLIYYYIGYSCTYIYDHFLSQRGLQYSILFGTRLFHPPYTTILYHYTT